MGTCLRSLGSREGLWARCQLYLGWEIQSSIGLGAEFHTHSFRREKGMEVCVWLLHVFCCKGQRPRYSWDGWLCTVIIKSTKHRGKVTGCETCNLPFLRGIYTAILTGTTSPGNSGCGSSNMACVCFPAGLSWLCHLYVLTQMLGFGPCVNRGVKPS